MVRTPLDAGRPHLLEPGAISTVFTEFYVYQNEPSGMAAPSPQVSEIKESQLRLCYIFFCAAHRYEFGCKESDPWPLASGIGAMRRKNPALVGNVVSKIFKLRVPKHHAWQIRNSKHH